jgi:flagellar biosynthesis protein FlhB
MATDDTGDKSEDPTEHRRMEERRKGNVARSTELNIAGHLLSTAAVLYFLGADLVESLGKMISLHIRTAGSHRGDIGEVYAEFKDVGSWAADSVLPWLFGLLLAAVAVNLAQVGFLVATDKLSLNINAINPITGLKRIFSARGVVTLLISLGKLGLLTLAAAWLIWLELPGFLHLTAAAPWTAALATGYAILKLSIVLSVILIVLGVADYAFQKWKHNHEIMMTKEEVRREMKEMDGDPLIRRRRRDAHQKLIEARDISKVSASAFVLTNPTHFAIAFQYNPPEVSVPTVVAKGADETAFRMREIAAENGIPIIERPELARQVYRTLKVGQSIPADLYDVFIEILKYVYTITGKTISASDIEDVAA